MAPKKFLDELISVMAKGPGSGGSGGGNGGSGIGNGGGIPPGKGEDPTTDTTNNLSFPAIFFNSGSFTNIVRSNDPGVLSYDFNTPYYFPSVLDTGDADTANYDYFAQPFKLLPKELLPADYEQSTWQASALDYSTYTENDPLYVDYIAIGDQIETAQLKPKGSVRLELALYEDPVDVDPDGLYAYEMTVLGGAKSSETGKAKPKSGATERQGARIDVDTANREGLLSELTATDSVYTTDLATLDIGSYMDVTVQQVTKGNVAANTEIDSLTGVSWTSTNNGTLPTGWTSTDPGTEFSAPLGVDLTTGVLPFGPELTVSGTLIGGASKGPFKFTAPNNSTYTYVITFSIDDNAPFAFDDNSKVGNFNRDTTGDFDVFESYEGLVPDPFRETFVVPGETGVHNGLAYLVVEVPSQPPPGDI